MAIWLWNQTKIHKLTTRRLDKRIGDEIVSQISYRCLLHMLETKPILRTISLAKCAFASDTLASGMQMTKLRRCQFLATFTNQCHSLALMGVRRKGSILRGSVARTDFELCTMARKRRNPFTSFCSTYLTSTRYSFELPSLCNAFGLRRDMKFSPTLNLMRKRVGVEGCRLTDPSAVINDIVTMLRRVWYLPKRFYPAVYGGFLENSFQGHYHTLERSNCRECIDNRMQ